MRNMIKVRVDWDTDGEQVCLPEIVEVPDDIEEDYIADYLSDEYGWCVLSFNYV